MVLVPATADAENKANSTPSYGPQICSLGFHAAMMSRLRSSNPYNGDEAKLWLYGFAIGAEEIVELDEIQDIDGLGSLFEARD
jgi:hypothetical protein